MCITESDTQRATTTLTNSAVLAAVTWKSDTLTCLCVSHTSRAVDSLTKWCLTSFHFTLLYYILPTTQPIRSCSPSSPVVRNTSAFDALKVLSEVQTHNRRVLGRSGLPLRMPTSSVNTLVWEYLLRLCFKDCTCMNV